MTRLAWHFLRADGKLRDGRAAPPDGEWLTHTGPLVPCESGLHASENIIDALRWAPGSWLERVELGEPVIAHGEGSRTDKIVSARRRTLWHLTPDVMDPLLRVFARWSALQVIDLWDAAAVVREYLETGDESKQDAAWNAVWDGASAFSGNTFARTAARNASARNAVARNAARDAGTNAENAASIAAASAAWYARAASIAAWNARVAAWDAARVAQAAELERLVRVAHGASE